MEHPGYHEKQCHEQQLEGEHRNHLVQTTAELTSGLKTAGVIRVWEPDSKLFADYKGVKKEDGSVSVVDLRRSLISRLFKPFDFQARISKK